jgi:hypothetical protein
MIRAFLYGLFIGIIIGVALSLVFCHHMRLLNYGVILSVVKKWSESQRLLHNQAGRRDNAVLNESSSWGHQSNYQENVEMSKKKRRSRSKKSFPNMKGMSRRSASGTQSTKRGRYLMKSYELSDHTAEQRDLGQQTEHKRKMSDTNLDLFEQKEMAEELSLNYPIYDRNSNSLTWKHRYASKIQTAASKVYDCWKETEGEGWVKSSSTQGYQVYRKKRSKLPLDIIKGVCLLPFPLETCIADFFSDKGREAYEDSIAERKVLETLGKGCHGREVVYSCTVDKYPMVSVRDMVLGQETILIKTNTGSKQTYPVMVVTTSVEVDTCPVRKKAVRVDMPFAGTIFETKSASQTLVTMIIDIDVKGWLPKWLVNFAADECASPPLKLRKFMKEKYNASV